MSAFADMLFQTGVQMTALQAGIELCQSCGEAPVEASGALCENCLDVLADLRHVGDSPLGRGVSPERTGLSGADQDEGGQP